MKQQLAQQIAIVTGANSGIGAGVAKALASEGATLVINYPASHLKAAADTVVAEIVASGGKAISYQCDVSNEAEVVAMFAHAVTEFGTVDILINNAGIQQDAAFTEMTLTQWQRVLDVNLTGQFLCAREAIREFLRRGPNPEKSRALGKIICISSVHEVIPWAGHANYAASKGGVMLMMKTIAQEYAGHKIRINSIAPGAIQTPINRDAWETPQALEKLLKLIPYQRIGQTDDIGRAAIWLASDSSDYINGTTLFVDGGMTLYPGFSTGG